MSLAREKSQKRSEMQQVTVKEKSDFTQMNSERWVIFPRGALIILYSKSWEKLPVMRRNDRNGHMTLP